MSDHSPRSKYELFSIKMALTTSDRLPGWAGCSSGSGARLLARSRWRTSGCQSQPRCCRSHVRERLWDEGASCGCENLQVRSLSRMCSQLDMQFPSALPRYLLPSSTTLMYLSSVCHADAATQTEVGYRKAMKIKEHSCGHNHLVFWSSCCDNLRLSARPQGRAGFPCPLVILTDTATCQHPCLANCSRQPVTFAVGNTVLAFFLRPHVSTDEVGYALLRRNHPGAGVQKFEPAPLHVMVLLKETL